MRLVFLGTSSATPTRFRNVSGLAFNRRNRKAWFLVDCGEGTQQQILHTDYSLVKLRAIFITHVHGDHCYGLPGLITSASLLGRTEPLTIVAPVAIRDFLDATFAATAVHLSFSINFVPVEEMSDMLELDGVGVTAVPLSHRVPSFAFRFAENRIPAKLDTEKLDQLGIQRGHLWGQLQSGKDVSIDDGRVLRADEFLLKPRKPRCIVIAGDNDKPELLAEACAGANLLVHEATYTEAIIGKQDPETRHSSALRVARFAESVPGLENLILTHFSARYGAAPNNRPSIDDIRNEARTVYTGTLSLASDLAHYLIDYDGMLTEHGLSDRAPSGS